MSSIFNLVPIQVREEGMSANFFSVVYLPLGFVPTDSLFWVFGQKGLQDRFGLRAQIWLPRDVLVNNVSNHLLLVIPVVMRRPSAQHLVHESAKRPPIHLKRMAFALNDFWRQIFWSATKRIGFLALG